MIPLTLVPDPQAPLRLNDLPQRVKLRVTLVRGPFVSTLRAASNEATPCLGLAYIAGYLHQYGYAVTIVDAVGEDLNRFWTMPEYPGLFMKGLSFAETIDKIPADTDVIGFSAMFSAEWPIQRALITATRERFPNALFVAGGEHITALPEYSLRDCPALDVCVRGEGEHPFYELVESWGNDRDVTGVNGIVYRDAEGQSVINGNLPRIKDLNSIPWPYWPDGYLEKYWAAGKSYGVHSERDMPLMVSRGCPFRCTFCSSPQMWTTTYKLREVDDVIAEIKAYQQKYNITAFQLYDLTAIVKKNWTIEFCQKLLDGGIHLKWSLPSGTRSEALDKETLAYLQRTGCNYLCYAPESGSPDTLKLIKKAVKLPRITESIIEAKRLGLILRTNLVVGFPGETRHDVYLTFKYGLTLAIRGVDEVSVNVFSPYPGSEIFNDLFQAGKVKLDDSYLLRLTSNYTDYTNLNLIGCNAEMGARELALWRAAFMVTGYLIGYVLYPSRILRTLRNVFFTSNEAATVFEHRFKDALSRIKVVVREAIRPRGLRRTSPPPVEQ
jgi:anaerobic magnesium-protoporphyrin IX monomethyl ester cyclase